MPINSRDKGASAEREFGAILREWGYVDARRGQQRAGGADSPDVIGLPGFHPELKRTERFALYDAVNQARRDSAGSGLIPVVFHRCNATRRKGDCRGEWLTVLGLVDFFELIRKAGYGPPPTLEDLI